LPDEAPTSDNEEMDIEEPDSPLGAPESMPERRYYEYQAVSPQSAYTPDNETVTLSDEDTPQGSADTNAKDMPTASRDAALLKLNPRTRGKNLDNKLMLGASLGLFSFYAILMGLWLKKRMRLKSGMKKD
jgi:hypothetical protein